MAENPRFNNSGMFTNSGDNYSDITPDSTSEVLATQGNVINSIKVFWNKLRAKLAYAISRPNTDNAVGSHYQPVYIDEHGVVQVCAPETIVATIESGSKINIGDIPVHPGKTICVRFNGSFGGSATALKIGNVSVIYPSGADVYPANVNIDGTYLFTYMAGAGSTKWVLISSMNTASTSYSGLMSKDDKEKLDGIANNANNYSLPTASDTVKGGVMSSNNNTNDNALKRYHVNVDGNGIMTVDVPWTDTHEANWEANLRVGTANSTDNDTTSDAQETYIKTVENGEVHGRVKVVGKNDITISSTDNGELEINGPNFPILSSSQYNALQGYRVRGPGSSKATTDYFLAGNGTWQKGTPSKYMVFNEDASSLHMEGSNVVGTLQVKTSSGGSIDFYLVNWSGDMLVSDNNKLSISSDKTFIMGRAYPILSRAVTDGVREVRPGFIVFTPNVNGLLSGKTVMGTIF